jgi:hypothetical protein
MTCEICGGRFRDNDKVLPVLRYVTGKNGDFVNPLSSTSFIHLHHLKATVSS